jgi:hypothetical protein
MTNEVETQDAQEVQAFATAFDLNDQILDCADMMQNFGLGDAANRTKLAALRVQLKQIIADVVKKYMRRGDKDELEKLFASVAKTVNETRAEVLKRRDANPVRANQLLHDLDALEGLASDYSTAIFGKKV